MAMKRLCIALLALPLGGCDGCPQERRVPSTEVVKCVGKTFHESHSHTSINPVFGGKNVQWTVTTVNIPESHGTIFECQHGTFAITRKDVWEKTRIGEMYMCFYDEMWEHREGDPDFSKDLFKGYDFKDVEPYVAPPPGTAEKTP